MSKEINIIELFSGIGGFTKGFIDAGYKINKHFFSEIDKHAIANYKHNFKNAEYIGSVTDVRGEHFRGTKINVITFGSPCQDFSLAGKREGMDGTRSSLITEAIRLVTEVKPDIFIWENVKGAFSSNNSEDFWSIINAFANIGGYRLEWQLLNTSWFLPQNRERIYLIGHLAGRSEPGVFPITENNRWINERAKQTRSIRTLTAGGHSGGLHSSMTLINQVKSGTLRTHKDGQGFRQTKGNDCPTIPARAGEDGSGQVIIQVNNSKESGGKQPFQQNRIYATEGISTTLCKDKSDLLIKVNSATKQGFEVAKDGDSINLSNPNSETRRGRVGVGVAQTLDTQCNQATIVTKGHGFCKSSENSISPTLKSSSFEHNNHVCIKAVLTPNRLEKRQNGRRFKEDGEDSFTLSCQDQHGVQINNSIRRITEIECERLQGFEDNWTKYGIYEDKNGIESVKEVPKTQRYKMCGNAVTVKVVEEIVKRLKFTNEK